MFVGNFRVKIDFDALDLRVSSSVKAQNGFWAENWLTSSVFKVMHDIIQKFAFSVTKVTRSPFAPGGLLFDPGWGKRESFKFFRINISQKS